MRYGLHVPVSELNGRTKSSTGDISVDSAGVRVGLFIHGAAYSLIQLKEG